MRCHFLLQQSIHSIRIYSTQPTSGLLTESRVNMKKLNSEKSKRFSIALKLSQFRFFANRKSIGVLTPATDLRIITRDLGDSGLSRTCPPRRRNISSPKTARFQDSENCLSSYSDENENCEKCLSGSAALELSENDVNNILMNDDAMNCIRQRKKANRRSLDVSHSFIRYRDHEERKMTRERRARSLTRLQRVMWNQRRNTIGTEEIESPKQSPRKMSSNGVILRQKNPFRSGNRLSIFQNSAETFLTLIRDPERRKSFRAFLKSEYSEENLDFWLQCEEYRQMKPKMRRKTALKIFQTYLGGNALREINIDAGTRAKTESQLENPQENTFDDAQRHIFDLMERDSFRRFIMSEKSW